MAVDPSASPGPVSEPPDPASRPSAWARLPMPGSIVRLLERLPPGAILLSLLTFASYLMGLLRDRVFARTFGAGSELDVYNAALVLPELVLDVLVLAGLSAAFVPVLLRTEQDDAGAGPSRSRAPCSRRPALIMARRSRPCCSSSRPGPWSWWHPASTPRKREQYTGLFRQMCLTALVFAVSFALGELLVARQRFLAYGVAPLLYNLGIVLGALLLAPSMGIEGVAIGTLIGALLHLGIRVAGVRAHGLPISTRRWTCGRAEFREYLRLSVPRAVAQPIEAVTFLFFTRVASGWPPAASAAVSFARNFQSVPVSLIGIAFSVAAFPVLSRVAASGDRGRFRRLVRDNVLLIGGLSALAGLALALVSGIAIRVLLGGEAFDEEDVAITTTLLVAFAISVPLESLSHVLARAVYATRDTLLPVVASLVGLATIVRDAASQLRGSQGLVAVPLGFAAGMAVRVGDRCWAPSHGGSGCCPEVGRPSG